MQPALEQVERVHKIAGRRPHGRRVNRQGSGIDQRRANRTLWLAETLDIQSNTVPREQALPRLAIRSLAKSFAVRVAEDVDKEHVGILAIGLEEQNVGMRILAAV